MWVASGENKFKVQNGACEVIHHGGWQVDSFNSVPSQDQDLQPIQNPK
jgi:hypothetical protein